jgi:hypothetical protein
MLPQSQQREEVHGFLVSHRIHGFSGRFQVHCGNGFNFNLPIAVVVHFDAKYLAGGGISPPPAP